MKKVLSILICVAMVLSLIETTAFAAASPTGVITGLEDSLRYSEALATDGYIGIPVDIYVYHNGNTTNESPLIFYVMNANVERIGTDSDYSIVNEMVNEMGYIVVVIDYKNNPLSVSPALDWSTQNIRTLTNDRGLYLNGAAYKKGYTYVVPSGYNVTLDEYYWSIDKHGADGSLDKIVEIWNNDFTGVYGNKQISYPDGTTALVKDTPAQTIYDCVRPDGRQLDMDLRMDIIYPTNPVNPVPVMTLYSSDELRIGAWTSPKRPHLTGSLFAGCAGAVFDYGYTPMARTDHYNYFDGNGAGSQGGITGDNYTYSMDVFSGVKSQTAAIRHLRWLADQENTKYKFDKDKFGVYGNSKGGLCTRLGVPNAEEMQELRWFVGHTGETRFDNGDTETVTLTTAHGTEYTINGGEPQPWLTYSDGSKIPSNVQFVYANCGGGYEDIKEGHAATFASGSMQDGSYWGFYPGVVTACRAHDVPLLNYSMSELGHALVYGTDKYYGKDGYAAYIDMMGYYLKDYGAAFQYIDIKGDREKVDTKSNITFKFSGGIEQSEIEKITIRNTVTDELVSGVWSPSFGKTTWEFAPKSLKGGYEYEINIPDTIICSNGAAIKNGVTESFKTVREELKNADMIASDGNDMTLVKTQNSNNGVYYMFDNVDFDASTTVDMRFGVENDAANVVEVYAIDDINEADLASSQIGDKLGEVVLTGKGDYDFDVTDYVKALGTNRAGFLLRAKKNVETKVITNYDFDELAVGTNTISGITASWIVENAVSDDFSVSGSNSLKLSYMQPTNSFAPYHTHYDKKNHFATVNNALSPSKLTAADLGRKFNISMKVYDTSSRRFRAEINNWAVNSFASFDLIDFEASVNNATTAANEWKTIDLDYRVKNEIAWSSQDQRKLAISAETRTPEQNEPLYIDDILVTEDVSEVKIADNLTAFANAPQLVLHPAETQVLNVADSAYVESGDNKDNEIASENLLVSGRAIGLDASVGKSYVKLAIDNFTSGQAYFAFRTGARDNGTLRVYGISDKALAEGWSSETINYINAPANDIYTTGVDTSKMFDNGTLAVYDVAGAADYQIDITRYVANMKAKGADYVTLVFTNDTPTEKVILDENLDGPTLEMEVGVGGGISSRGRTLDEDHTGLGGYSYYMAPSQYAHERIKLDILGYNDITASDVGRRFRVTYWAKGDFAGSFTNQLMAYRCSHQNIQKKTQILTAANEWQQLSFDMEITSDMIDHQDTADGAIITAPATMLDFEGVAGGNKLYIDDLVVSEIDTGNITITPVSSVNTPNVVSRINFDAMPAGKASKDIYTSSGFEGATVLDITSEEDYTSGSGKSLMFKPNAPHNRLKIKNIFGRELTSEDVGRKLHLSFKAKANRTGSFTYGLMCLVERLTTYQQAVAGNFAEKSNEEGGKYHLAESEGNAIDADDFATKPYRNAATGITGHTATITEAELNKWIGYEFDITITPDMLKKVTWNKWDAAYVDSAVEYLGIISDNLYSGDKSAAIYIDDVLVTEVEDEDVANGVINTIDFDTATNVSTLYGASGFGANRVSLTTEEDATTGNGKSFKFQPDTYYNRLKFIKTLSPDGLTAADVGRELHVSFKAKATSEGAFTYGMMSQIERDGKYQYTLGEDETPDPADYGDNIYTSAGTSSHTATVSAADVGKWITYEFDVVVNEAMLPKTVWHKYQEQWLEIGIDCLGIISTNMFSTDQSKTIYIDDITVVDNALVPKGPFMYSQDVEQSGIIAEVGKNIETLTDNHIITGNGCDYAYVNNTNTLIDTATISSEANHTDGGGKSLRLKSTAVHNRFKLLKLWDMENVGATYDITFFVKANKTGSFYIAPISTDGEYAAKAFGATTTITVDSVDTWQKVTYSLTYTQAMHDNLINALVLCPSQMGQSKTTEVINSRKTLISEDPAIIYVDDIYSAEQTDNPVVVPVSESAYVAGNGTVDTQSIRAKGPNSDTDIRNIKKAYLKLDGGDYAYTQNATLTFEVLSANGQTINVYAVSGADYPDSLTYTNAPASYADERMDLSKASRIGTFELTGGNSIYSIDVTDYIKNNAPNDYIFAITSNDIGGCEYLILNFETFSFSSDVDFEGVATVSGGKANVSGNNIKILNAINSGKTVRAGDTYHISADVTSPVDCSYSLYLGESLAGTFELSANTEQTLECDYVATADDENAKYDYIRIAANGETSGFILDNVAVSSETYVTISKDASVVAEVACEPTPTPQTPTYELITSAQGNGKIIYNAGSKDEADLSSGRTQHLEQGTAVTLTAQELGGSTFMYWTQTDTRRIVSTEATYSFTLGSGAKLTAVFRDADESKLAVFKNGRNNQIVQLTYTPSTVTVPSDPYIMGYDFKCWIKDGIEQSFSAGNEIEIEEDSLFVSSYTKSDTEYTVTVNGGSGSGSYKYNDVVTATAAPAESGKKFSHWTRGGMAVSYNSSYTFYASGDTTVEAVYVADGTEIAKEPVIVIDASVVEGTNKIAFFAERDLPLDYTLVENGILLSTNPVIDLANNMIKAVATGTGNKGQYTIRKANVSVGTTWYGKAYMIYQNSLGKYVTVYSDVASDTMN